MNIKKFKALIQLDTSYHWTFREALNYTLLIGDSIYDSREFYLTYEDRSGVYRSNVYMIEGLLKECKFYKTNRGEPYASCYYLELEGVEDTFLLTPYQMEGLKVIEPELREIL